MAKMGKFSVSGMKKLQQELNKIQGGDTQAFIEGCAKELAARLLAKVIKRTQPGEYPPETGKKGGTLRRGWTAATHEEAVGGSGNGAPAAQYANSLKIDHSGNMYRIEIVNPVEYASYVEFGHRTRDHKGWIPGKFMLTISEQEIRDIAPYVLEQHIKQYLQKVFH